MNVGDIVERKEILGYKGILLDRLYTLPEYNGLSQLQLNLYKRDPMSFWKVLWFKHPFEEVPQIDGLLESDLIRVMKKEGKNGL